MKKPIIFIACISIILLLTSCGEETKESMKKGIETPVDNYMDSRVNAMDMAKQSVKESNKKVTEQNKAMDTFTK
jgi:hypothetical protein